MKRKLGLGIVAILVVAMMAALPTLAAAQPRYGGELLAAIAGDAPSFDPHRETTFKTIMVIAPAYNTLMQFSPTEYPKIIGDLATGRYYLATAERRIRQDLKDLWSNDDAATTNVANRLLAAHA